MGITIHYETAFTGTKAQLIEKLNELAKISKEIGFVENGPIYEVDYAVDFNTRDQHTPMIKNKETGKFEIDSSYRWAKLQAEPRKPMLSYNDTEKQRTKKAFQIKKIQEQAKKTHGFILSLWWGEGCEATNLPFVAYNGAIGNRKRKWTGSSFTKTQYASEFVKAHVSVCAILKHAEKLGLIKDVYDEGDFYNTEDITVLIDNGEENLKIIASCGEILKKTFGEQNIEGAGSNATEMLKDYDIGQNK